MQSGVPTPLRIWGGVAHHEYPSITLPAMHRITAVLHTHNDGLRLGRCLETLYPCDGALIIDHGSEDDTLRVAREYGARVMSARNLGGAEQYLQPWNAGWVLCLSPKESLTEALAASLYEWKLEPLSASAATAFSVFLREETSQGWIAHRGAQTRLVPSDWSRWKDFFPVSEGAAPTLDGALLRFWLP
jgi:(heptosyl)LPS beta-1,4-glucosyltransferase